MYTQSTKYTLILDQQREKVSIYTERVYWKLYMIITHHAIQVFVI